jgi:CRISPR type I-D-associated protein Csc2
MPKVTIPESFTKISDYFVEEISPHLDSRVIQVLVLRQTHDYTVLRTEESRELNTVVVPESITSITPTVKVSFLASKQKAVENRMAAKLLRAVKDDYNCHLMMNLCMKCPRCALFGAVNVKGNREYNIKHRIEYSTCFSIERYEDLLETLTFNAIDDANQTTGQALNLTHNVRPLANFPSVVSLNSVTWRELVLYLKSLLAAKSYGAETRVKGDVRNTILGIVAGHEEVITSLEYSLELADDFERDLHTATEEVLNKYKELCASRSDVVVLTADETQKLVGDVQDISIDADFADAMWKQVDAFIKSAKAKAK